MQKFFFYNRYIAVSGDFEECFRNSSAVVYTLRSLNDIPALVTSFESTNKLAKLWLYIGELSEESVINRICSTFIVSEAAGGLVQNTNSEILMIFRHRHWDLPKGKREANESIEETALREVEEECSIHGLSLHKPITQTFHFYRENEVRMLKHTFWFNMLYKGNMQPTPQLEEGIEQAEWVSPNVLPSRIERAFSSIREVFIAAGLAKHNEPLRLVS